MSEIEKIGAFKLGNILDGRKIRKKIWGSMDYCFYDKNRNIWIFVRNGIEYEALCEENVSDLFYLNDWEIYKPKEKIYIHNYWLKKNGREYWKEKTVRSTHKWIDFIELPGTDGMEFDLIDTKERPE